MPLPLIIAGAAAVGSGVFGAAGELEAGKAGKRAKYMEAASLERRAKQEEGAGSRTAVEVRRQGEKLKSDATLAIVAGGGVSDDAGALEIQGDIAGVTNYNALMAIWEGKSLAQQSREAADIARIEGDAAESAGKAGAASSLLGGIAGAFSL